jgi:hypothetical protein
MYLCHKCLYGYEFEVLTLKKVNPDCPCTICGENTDNEIILTEKGVEQAMAKIGDLRRMGSMFIDIMTEDK